MPKDLTAEQLERQAAVMLERASEMRQAERESRETEALAREPQFEDSVIMWYQRWPHRREHRYDPSSDDGYTINYKAGTYTYVAFRRIDGMWHTTARNGHMGKSWVDLIKSYPQLRDGNFWIVSEWIAAKETTDE